MLRYVVARISLARAVRLSDADLSLVRVAVARAGARLLPAPLVAGRDDHATAARLLERGDATIVAAQ